MNIALPHSWRWVPLCRCLQRQRDLITPFEYADTQFNSIGLEDIAGGGTGELSIQKVSGQELASAKSQFSRGDLLYGRLRPYLNKVAIAPCDGVCSTEIWAFRALPPMDARFGFYMLASPYMLARVTRFTEGANLPRVEASSFDRIEIPVPPLSEQRRIVEILNEAREIRQLRQEADDLTDQLIPAIFDEMFGNKLRTVSRTTLGSISDEVRYGTSRSSEDSGFVTLRIPNVVGDLIDYHDLVTVPLERSEASRYFLERGDLLFVRTNGNPDYIGRSGVYEPSLAAEVGLEPAEIIFASYLIRVRLRSGTLRPAFVAAYLRTAQGRADILRQAKTSAGQYNINTQGLKSLSLPVFSDDSQVEFLRIVEQVTHLTHRLYTKSEHLLDKLTGSLLAHAFNGSLTANWRSMNSELVSQESEERDQWLARAGVTPAKVAKAASTIDTPTDGRHVELNREQRDLLGQIQKIDLGDNGQVFTLSTLVSELEEPLDRLPVDAIRRHLDVLAARGLVKAVSRRVGDSTDSDYAFGNLYRLPRKDEEVIGTGEEPDYQRISELARLANQGRVVSASASNKRRLGEAIDTSDWGDHTQAPDTEE